MILIVDDKPENIFSLRRTLELNGFDVDTAGSGEEALKKVLKNIYSLIILDVQMPGMDGFEVAETLSGYSKARDIPIIFLSAVNTDKKFITRGYTSGGVDYVTKPVDPDIFMLKVKTLNRLYEQNRELNEMRLSLLEEVEIRKQAEQQLSNMLKELRSVMESLPQVSFTMSAGGDLEYVNQQWYLYSNDAHEFPSFHAQDKGVLQKLQDAMRAGMAYATEVRVKSLVNNTYRYHLLKVIPVKENNTVLRWVGTFTDINEQKLANEALEAKVALRTLELMNNNRKLENSNHELQQFASVASHDLKEPLRKIQIFSSIIRDRYIKDSTEAMDSVNKVIDASARMTGLINDLLDYSRLSVESLFQELDLNQLLADIQTDMEIAIKDKNAIIIIDQLPAIEGIPGQIRQVFQNLISNSLKFSKADELPVITIKAEKIDSLPGAPDTGQYCRILFSDNGIGFDEAYSDRIFTIFQRLHSREAYEGTGIGLAIVKKIVDKHKGQISAYSKEGEGATFIMTLPVHHIQANNNNH